ncbi:MAG: SCO family protein, partial [Actinomycetota bacterium]
PTDRPDFVLTDTAGEPFDFRAETGGELTLMYFGYTECPDICPVHLAQLSEALERPGMPQATVVFVSVDPARDTPDVIRDWLDNFDDDFVGLTGSVDDLIVAQEAAGVVPADIEGDPQEAGYLVGHAGQLLAYAPDDRGYVIYPFGTRQSELVNDLPVLAEFAPPELTG